MSPILVLLRKELLIFTRHRSAVVITFFVPIILIYIFGFVFGLTNSGSPRPGITVAIVNQSPEEGAKSLIAALKKEKGLNVLEEQKETGGKKHLLTEQEVRAQIHDNQYRFAIILPPDFLSDDRPGVRVVYLHDPRNEIESQTVNGLLQKTVFSNVPGLLAQSFSRSAKKYLGGPRFDSFNRSIADALGSNFKLDTEEVYQRLGRGDYFGVDEVAKTNPASDPSLRRFDATPVASKPESVAKMDKVADSVEEPNSAAVQMMSRIVKIDSEQLTGKQVKNPMASRLIGGYAVMFLLFAVVGFSSGFFEEKRSGIFHRVLSTGARRHHILWAKYLFCVLLGLSQIAVLFLFGNILYGLDLFSHLVPLFAVALGCACACAAFGMLVASIASNPQAANGLSTFLVLTMSAVGGAWFPVSFMPDFIQKLAHLTVVYWSVEGFSNVLWAGQSLLEVLPGVGVLFLMAMLAQGFALWRFRTNDLFD